MDKKVSCRCGYKDAENIYLYIILLIEEIGTNLIFATNSNFLIPTSLKPDDVTVDISNLSHLTEFIV